MNDTHPANRDDAGLDSLPHAFVDGELAPAEQARALERLESDAAFRQQICEIRALKERVRGAYPLVDRASVTATPTHRSQWAQAMAAGLVLALGLGAGWLVRDRQASDPVVVDRLAGLPAGYQPVALANRVDPDRVVLHLDSSEPLQLTRALDLAEALLAERRHAGRIEVVVNSYGLNLLREDVTPHRQRIEALARRHANLSFVACGQTVTRLRREGTQVHLMPEAQLAPSAIGEILTRMQAGWVYVKV